MKQRLLKCLVGLLAFGAIGAMVISNDVSAAKRRAPKRVHFQSFDSGSGETLNLGSAPGKTSLTLAEVSVSGSGTTPISSTLQTFVIEASACPNNWNGVTIIGGEVLRVMDLANYSTVQLTFSPNLTVPAPGTGKISCLVVTPSGGAGGFVSAGASGFQVIPR